MRYYQIFSMFDIIFVMFHNIKYRTAVPASPGFYFEKDIMNLDV